MELLFIAFFSNLKSWDAFLIIVFDPFPNIKNLGRKQHVFKLKSSFSSSFSTSFSNIKNLRRKLHVFTSKPCFSSTFSTSFLTSKVLNASSTRSSQNRVSHQRFRLFSKHWKFWTQVANFQVKIKFFLIACDSFSDIKSHVRKLQNFMSKLSISSSVPSPLLTSKALDTSTTFSSQNQVSHHRFQLLFSIKILGKFLLRNINSGTPFRIFRIIWRSSGIFGKTSKNIHFKLEKKRPKELIPYSKTFR